MFLLVGGDEDVVLVFTLFPGPVLEGCDSVSILPVVVPLSFILETVRSFTDSEATSFVILPFTHVGLRDIGVQQFILTREKVL